MSTAQALSEKGNNSKCTESKSMTSSYALPLIMSVYEVKCQYLQNFFSYAPHQKKWKREITPKVLMPELYTLSMMSLLIILCPCMKFHLKSTYRTGVIVRSRKSDKGE